MERLQQNRAAAAHSLLVVILTNFHNEEKRQVIRVGFHEIANFVLPNWSLEIVFLSDIHHHHVCTVSFRAYYLFGVFFVEYDLIKRLWIF